MHRFLRSLFRNTILLALAVILAPAAPAQTANGTIAGTVVDATGAAIPGANITATDLATGISRKATSNSAGGYRIEAVQPGTYRVVVTAPSFATTTIEHAEVAASTVNSVNAQLAVAGANSTVEVSIENEGLRTDSGDLSSTISHMEVDELPIATLNPYTLGLTLPGVTTITSDDFTNPNNFSVDGNRPRDNNFLIEGAENNDQGIHGQAFQPENLEAIQEVTFLLSSFSPQYGGGGAVSNVLLQSGTNQFHGAVFERLLNSSLDATDHSTVLNLQGGGTAGKTKSRENIFGFRFGGPIIHDRAFFFVSSLWDRFRSTGAQNTLILPTAAGYTVLNQYKSNPRIANLLTAYGGLVGTNQLYAASQDLGNGRGVVNFAGVQRVIGNDSNGRELEATGDVKISDADKIRVRFIQAPEEYPYDPNFPGQLPNFDVYQHGVSYNAGVTETHIFSPSVLNEVRLSWSRIGFREDLRPETYANPLALAPAINIGNPSVVQGYGIPSGLVPQGRFQNTYQLQDDLSYSVGRHSFKFGFDIDDIRISDAIPFDFYGTITYTDEPGAYSALANYMDDYSGTGNVGSTISFGNPNAHPTIWMQGYYAQDSWKVRPNLEVDYGLRYEYHGTPFNYLGYPGFNLSNPSAFPVNVPEVADSNNFGPRVGFNYQPIAGGKTAISGGFGVFYSHIFSNIIDNVQGTAPNTAAKNIVPSTSGRGSANWSQSLNVCSTCAIKSTAPLATDTANVITPKLLDPITYEYNLRLQRELPASFTLSAEYVGNRTEKDYATEEWNPTTPAGPRVVPNRGRIILEDNQGDSNYNALQLGLEHRQRHGLALRASYTYSKLLDDSSEIFTDASSQISTYAEIQRSPRRREYGPSAFDHRHRLSVAAVYQIPTWHATGAERIAGAVVNGFTFSTITSFQSGQPENVELGYDWNLDGITNDRPILLNKKAPITNWAIKGEDFFNVPAGTLCDGPEFWATNDPCKVVSAANTHWVASNFGTTQNTISRNALTTDHTSNTDMSVERSFHIVEHQSFDFRAEALNVFNQGNTGSYNANLITGVPYNGNDLFGNTYSGAVTFGNRYLSTTGGRTLRFYARYQF